MKITLIGMGSGCPESLTVQGYAALREADLILGARRLLSALPAGCTENRTAASEAVRRRPGWLQRQESVWRREAQRGAD